MNKKSFLFGCLLLAALPIRAQFTFITNNGTITITGYTNPAIVSVIIPSTISNLAVTAISSNAFARLDVSAITIPDSIIDIGSNAFYGCGYLTNAAIGGGAIEPDAFSLCIGLASVTLGSNVTSIGNEAFYGCESLPSLVIPGSVKDIGSNAFYSCSRLTNCTILSGVTNIGPYAFEACDQLTDLSIPNSTISIGSGACYSCTGLATVSIGGGVIESNAFNGCGDLTTVTLGANVTSIGDDAFYDCESLASVNIPDSVTNIGTAAFYDCEGLTGITLPNNLANIPDNVFNECVHLTGVSIPGSVTNIGAGAFSGDFSLTEVAFGSNPQLLNIGDGAFFDCSSLSVFPMPESVTSIGVESFDGCNLTSITIPEGVTNIPADAFFDCQALGSITIGSNVTSIGIGAFYGDADLTNVVFPASLTSIGSNAFEYCYYSVAFYFLGNAPIADLSVFAGDHDTVYYLPGATGWSSRFYNLSTVEWLTTSFTANPTNGPVPLEVAFTSAGVDNSTNTIRAWRWSFGDGSSSTNQNPTHTYTNAGTFSLTLTTTNSLGQEVAGYGPTLITATNVQVAFTASPTNGQNPLTVNFAASSVDSLGAAVTSWRWNFGDGSASTAQNPSHTYTNAGAFIPTLTAADHAGNVVAGLGPAAILVTNPPVRSGLVLNGNFETGDFTGWTLAGDGIVAGNVYNAVVDSSFASPAGFTYVHSGQYGAALGEPEFLATLTQSLTTVPSQSYVLSFWLENSADTDDTFQVNWNAAAGPAAQIYALTNAPFFGWTNLTFVVTASGTNTILQFAAENPDAYFGLDDISVVVEQPAIGRASLQGSNLVLEGTQGISNATYYVLASTNLTAPINQWTPVATNVLTTNGNFTFTVPDTVSSNIPQKFYIFQTQ